MEDRETTNGMKKEHIKNIELWYCKSEKSRVKNGISKEIMKKNNKKRDIIIFNQVRSKKIKKDILHKNM